MEQSILQLAQDVYDSSEKGSDTRQLAEELLVSLQEQKQQPQQPAGTYPLSLTALANLGEGLQVEIEYLGVGGLTLRVYNQLGELAGLVTLQANPEGVYLKRITYTSESLVDRTSQLVAPAEFSGAINPPSLAYIYSQAAAQKESENE